MVYRALTEYLLKQPQARGIPIYIGLLPIGISVASIAVLPSPILVVLAIIASIVLTIWLEFWIFARRRQMLAREEVLYESDWLEALKRFARERQLETRSHPRLIGDLEDCARLRKEVLDALKSEEWNQLSGQPAWKTVRNQCAQSAESLFRDALWAAKGAMRPLGGRKETFAKRCGDPAFAANALGSVRLAREQLGRLLEEVKDEPFAELGVRDALARAQAEIKAIHDAEEELQQIQWPLIEDESQ